jgi:hypothetical protein
LTLTVKVLNERLKVFATLNLKIKPDNQAYVVLAEALAVNKIDLVKHSKDPETLTETEAKRKLLDFLTANLLASPPKTKYTPIGHNIHTVDIPQIRKLIGLENWEHLFDRRHLDTGGIAKFLILQGKLKETNNGSLAQLAEELGVPQPTSHESEADCDTTLQVLEKMLLL